MNKKRFLAIAGVLIVTMIGMNGYAKVPFNNQIITSTQSLREAQRQNNSGFVFPDKHETFHMMLINTPAGSARKSRN